ncbi:hypothetical protein [Brevibacillus centrosporus]|uniref:hypothetical protein n=1 Tax=Brevibacillus centrosporus TaxID=54910 RepID=UPI003B01D8BF
MSHFKSAEGGGVALLPVIMSTKSLIAMTLLLSGCEMNMNTMLQSHEQQAALAERV